MANRFGRKRKRAMLAKLADQEHQAAFYKSESLAFQDGYARERFRADRLHDKIAEWQQRVVETLGRYSALLIDTPTIKVKDVRGVRNVHACADRMGAPSETILLEAAESTMVLLEHLCVTVERETRLHHLVRLWVEGPGGEKRLAFNYKIDRDAVMFIGGRKEDAMFVAMKVADEMIRALKGAK